MGRLFKLISFRHLRSEKIRTLLTLFGVALGVALVISVRLANDAIFHAFRGSIDLISGKTALQITGAGEGVEEELLEAVRREPGVRAVAPVMQTLAAVEGVEAPLLVMGVDPFSEIPFRDYDFLEAGETKDDFLDRLLDPRTLFLSEDLAARRGFSVGDPIRLTVNDQAHDFVVRGLLSSEGAARALGGHFALTDIAAYQWRFDRLGRLDRIDVAVEEGADVDALIRRLSEKLPAGTKVGRPRQRGAEVERMIAAFQLNLTALSTVTLLVALFIVYNTLLMSVVRRRTEMGILRALGTSPWAVFILFLSEALVMGMAGSLLGIPLGWVLAKWTLGAVEQTVSALYTPVLAGGLFPRPSIFLEGLLLGCGVSLLAGISPAVTAMRLAPREVLHPGSYEAAKSLQSARTAATGLLLLTASLALAQAPPVAWPWGPGGAADKPLFGFLSALCLLLGFACLVPAALALFNRLLQRLPLRWVPTELRLAGNGLASTLGRSSVAVTAILVGLAIMGGMMIMIESFRGSVKLWIDQTIRADLVVVPASRAVSGRDATLHEDVLGRLEGMPGLAALDPVRTMLVLTKAGEGIKVASRELAVVQDHSGLRMISGEAGEAIQAALEEGKVLVSEPLASRHGLGLGDRLTVASGGEALALDIAGIFYDYTTDGGRVLMDARWFEEHWPRQRSMTALGLYLAARADLEGVREEVRRRLGKNHQVLVVSNRELRTDILDIFDQTFKITYALELIAILVSMLGVTNTLLTATWERKKELAVLRVLGSAPAQIKSLILYEAVVVAAAGIALGLAAGLLLSQILIHVINKQSFGWTILFEFPWPGLSQAALLILAAALLSAYVPARYASSIQLREALQSE